MEPADARMTWEHVSSNNIIYYIFIDLLRLLRTLVRLLPDLQHGGGPGRVRMSVFGADLIHHALCPHLAAQGQGQGAV